MTAFEEFGVIPELGKAVDEMEWLLPTDVQAEVSVEEVQQKVLNMFIKFQAIPLILGGGDVLMAAETGSGKTGAFCLPILQIVHETLRDLRGGKKKNRGGTSSSSVTPWRMSLYDRGAALAITPDGLRCQSREQKEWHGGRATTGVKGSLNYFVNFAKSDEILMILGNGQFYYEATVTDEGLCRVGWSTDKASLDVGTDKFSYGFGGTGKKSNNKQFDDYGEAFGIHDVIGCLIDLNKGEISFTKNGKNLGIAFRMNEQMKRETFYPSVVLKNAEMLFNFGETDFKTKIPDGYVALCKADKDSVKVNPVAAGTGPAQEIIQKPNAPQSIIIEPSRELAEQTFQQLEKFKKHLTDPQIRVQLLVGGQSSGEQIRDIQKGVDIIVATPGRLEDFISQGHILLSGCRFFVLDEADGLLKQGNSALIDRIYKQIPNMTSDGQRLQMIVCSATLHDFEVKKMADRLMHFPTWVDLKGEDAVPDTVHHCVVMIDPQADKSWMNVKNHVTTDAVHANDNIKYGTNTPETLSEAVKILKGEYCVRAIREHKMDRAIIFCRTKIDCDNLENYLKKINSNEFSCVCLHADRAPNERKANLQSFKDKRVKYLICTDVAARGIDVTGLPFMINVTLPDEKSNYVHRIGRVGRAERMGLAISLVSSVPEKVWYHGQWCQSRGRNCWNTNLMEKKGCCIWYNEPGVRFLFH